MDKHIDLKVKNSSEQDEEIKHTDNILKKDKGDVSQGNMDKKENESENPTLDPITHQFNQIIEESAVVNLDALKDLTWHGVPRNLRHRVWKILLRYVPLNSADRDTEITRKRQDYARYIQDYQNDINNLNFANDFKEIQLDVPRTQVDCPLFQHRKIQDMMIRLLSIWSIKNPTPNYAKTMKINDLVTPLIAAFLEEYFPDINYHTVEVPVDFDKIFTGSVAQNIEADVYWCLCEILNGILTNYVFTQEGIMKPINKVKQITLRSNPELSKHLENHEVDFNYFAFKWVYCFLIRTLPLNAVLRLFDTYISDQQGFSIFQSYFCSGLLSHYSDQLKKNSSFEELIFFLNKIPTDAWTEENVDAIITEADATRRRFNDTTNLSFANV